MTKKPKKLKFPGKCLLCDREVSGSGCARHLSSCMKKTYLDNIDVKRSKRDQLVYHIKVKSEYLPFYWIHIAVSGSLTLEDIDHYLRKIWLDCCSHMSAFEIGDIYYNSRSLRDDPENNEIGEQSMDISLHRILSEKMIFGHIYDWGSSTHLRFEVKSIFNGTGNEEITLLAQNIIPELKCQYCEKNNAKRICSCCAWYTDQFLCCDSCLKLHECGEEMFLKIVNSPRTGTCAYE